MRECPLQDMADEHLDDRKYNLKITFRMRMVMEDGDLFLILYL